MKRRISQILSYLLVLFVLTGCWDQRQTDKVAYVYAIGLDLAEDEKYNIPKLKITYLIINPEYGSQVSGSTNETPQEIITFEAHDFITSKNLANAIVAKEITYDLLKVFVISEKLAKDKQFIRWMYDATKDREIRRDSYLIVTNDDITQFFEKNKPKLETRMDQYFNLILTRGIENGMIPEADLHRYFKITEADADLFLAIFGTTKQNNEKESTAAEDSLIAGELKVEGSANQTQFLGSAVFKEGQMIAKITGEETRFAVLLNDTLEMSDVLATYPDPFNENYRIATRLVKKEKNKVKMYLKKKPGKINITIPLTMEILSDHSLVNYRENPKKRKKLKEHIENILEQDIEKFIKRTQEEFKGEPFAWSLIARKEFLTVTEYKQFDWMKSYPNMKVNVAVDIRFGEFGRQGELPNYEQVRD
jgi:spore germination protein KC